MRPPTPTFWLLGGEADWRTGRSTGVGVGPSGIRLGAAASGPLDPSAPDGSLGGLVLPCRMALDDQGTLYLLGLEEPWIKRFDPAGPGFVPLPATGGRGREARAFRRPANLAVAGRDLYVADRGNRRVQVFDLDTLALLHVWARRDWDPADVAATATTAYILDRRHGRVYAHARGRGSLDVVVDTPAAAGRWSRLALDRDHRIHLLDAAASTFDVFDSRGRPLGRPRDPGEVRDRFDPPAIRLDHRGRFCLPASLARPCDRRPPAAGPPPESLLALCAAGAGGLLFDRSGHRATVDAAEPAGPAPYQRHGRWLSEALDSAVDRCQWHRIDLELGALPAGTAVSVSTYADQRPLEAATVETLPEELWETRYTVTGPTQPPTAEPGPRTEEFLVQSREGQYLWVRLVLAGDGYQTPVVGSMQVHYPRMSYLEYLPAVYRAEEESRWFLERFLSLFQREWDAVEEEIGSVARHFDPASVPAGPFLDELARWLAVPLEGTWEPHQRRRLLQAAPAIAPHRGTPAGVRAWLRVYLENMTGLRLGDGDYPQLLEGFQERTWLQLAVDRTARLGSGAPLWSPGIVGRLQLDVFAREGEVRLVSTGDPERDVFHQYAHRFRVFVPAAWVRTRDDERMVRRALDTERPAHTAYDLCLVEPRFRVGVQSTVGLDTILGPYPVARLACRHDTDTAPSLPPRHRLGYDTVLAGRATGAPGPRLQPASWEPAATPTLEGGYGAAPGS
jgi:phage tail-like protein